MTPFRKWVPSKLPKKTNNPNPSPTGKIWFGLYCFGAANRTRTGTESLQVDFKSTMSTYSIIAAYASLKNEGWKVGGMFWRDAPNFPNFKFKKLAFL